MGHSLTRAIDWWAREIPGTVALQVGADRVTYAAFGRWVARIAADLRARGVKPGDRVGTVGANSAEHCAALFGTIRAGAIAVPLSIRATARELQESIADLGPTILICDQERAAKLADVPASVIELDAIAQLRIEGAEPPSDLPHPEPDTAAVIISTSGSTARPKGVMLSHRGIVAYVAELAVTEPGCGLGASALVLAPLSTSAGFVQTVQYLMLGATVHLEAAFDAQRTLDILNRHRIAALMGVPVFFERIAACPGFADADLSHLRLAMVGGARVSAGLLQTWLHKGVVLRQLYGQTEAGGGATVATRDLAAISPEKCGRGGMFTQIATIDSEGHHCPPGTPGEIIIKGPSLMMGYWNNPQATAQVLRDGWLHTGDWGVLDEGGNLTFLDRLKDIIISGGLNISAAEVERAVSEFQGVEEVAVIAAPDDRFGETPLAVLYSSTPVDVGALIRYCNDRLADYKVPRYVVVESEPLPRLPTGKLSKVALRDRYRDATVTLPRVR